MITINFAEWTWFEWAVYVSLFSWAYTSIAFMALCTAKRMRAAAKLHGFDLPKGLLLLCFVLLVIGAPADVIYNWTIGNIRFGIRNPWKITYSSRVEWNVTHLDRSDNPKQAIRWSILLNAGDEGHIDGGPLSQTVAAPRD